MAYYNNSYGRGGGGYSRSNGWGGSGGYSRGYQNGGGRQIRKRSGAKLCSKDNRIYISAWRKNRTGFYTLFARDYRGTKEITSASGKVWYNLFVTITNNTTMETRNCSGLYDAQRKRLYIKDFNQIVSINGGAGGYWGKHIGRR